MPAVTCEKAIPAEQARINLHLMGNGAVYECNIITSNRGVFSQNERFLSHGWYDFVRENNLREGDQLLFCLDKPTDNLFVRIIRRAALG